MAGLFADDRFWLHVAVFAACTSGPAYGLGWLVFLSRAADVTVRFSVLSRREA